MKDFFLSYNKADVAWAEWIAWQLEAAGHTTVLQAWDFHAGGNFILEMQEAATDAKHTLALLSPDYLTALFTQPEWAAAFVSDPTGAGRKLLPIRVRECEPEGLLKAVVYIDLVGKTRDRARKFLLQEIQKATTGERGKPESEPAFPQKQPPEREEPGFPGTLPRIWNVPHLRNQNFTGREDVLAALRETLTSNQTAAVTQPQAIHGLGGIGKTQIALEYAYRYLHDYSLIWWLAAEEAVTLAGDYAQLAGELDLPEKDAREQAAAIQAVRRWFGEHGDWLLIFDNVDDPKEIRDYLPQAGHGHVLITSRDRDWRGVAKAVEVEVLPRPEAKAFLLKRTGLEDETGAGAVAKALGDLPLALAQAAAYISTVSISFADYLELFEQQSKKLLQKGELATGYQATVATTWEMAFKKLEVEAPAAIELLNLCAFLAPEEIPLDLFEQTVDKLPDALKAAMGDKLARNDLLAALLRYSLIARQGDRMSMHRLVQAVIRERLSRDDSRQYAELAVTLVRKKFPFDSDDVRFWPECEALLAHGLSATGHADKDKAASPDAAALMNQMGLYLKSRARYAEAEPLYRRALELGEKTLGPDHPAVAIRLNNLALLLKTQSKLAEAEPLYRRALELGEKTLGPDHPAVAIRLNNLALLLKTQSKLAEAEPLYRRALELGEKTLGPDHPAVAIRLNNLALLLKTQSKLAEAEPLYRRALEIREEKLGPDHPDVAQSLNNLAGLLEAQGKGAEAEPLCRRALEIREEKLGPDHPDVAQSLNNLAGLLQDQGNYAEAEPLYRRALEIREEKLGPDHPDVAQSLNNLAGLLQDQGNYAEAEPLYRRALKILEESLGQDHPSTKTVRRNYQSLLDEKKGKK